VLRAAAYAALLASAVTTRPVTAAESAPAFPEPRVRQWQTGLLRADRLQHASLSLTTSLSIGLATREPVAGAGGVMALGILKELWDMRRTRFDPVDLAADGLGAGIGAVLTRAIQR